VLKAAGDRKTKAKNQLVKKSKKRNIYRSERLTCGTHEAAASSMIPRRQGIKRGQKYIHHRKLLLFIEDVGLT
jgi:hypothetical protein